MGTTKTETGNKTCKRNSKRSRSIIIIKTRKNIGVKGRRKGRSWMMKVKRKSRKKKGRRKNDPSFESFSFSSEAFELYR